MKINWKVNGVWQERTVDSSLVFSDPKLLGLMIQGPLAYFSTPSSLIDILYKVDSNSPWNKTDGSDILHYKIQLLKWMRGLTGMGLKEAKDFIDGVYNLIPPQTPIEDARILIFASMQQVYAKVFKFGEPITDTNPAFTTARNEIPTYYPELAKTPGDGLSGEAMDALIEEVAVGLLC